MNQVVDKLKEIITKTNVINPQLSNKQQLNPDHKGLVELSQIIQNFNKMDIKEIRILLNLTAGDFHRT